jgi:signal transduction histidine kinase
MVLERAAATLLNLDPAAPLLLPEVAAMASDDRDGPPRQTVLVALRARNAFVGLLCIMAQTAERRFTPADVAFAQTVAGVLASAIDNAHLFAQARTTAAEQERRRLARELHDSVSQALFAASRIAETLPLLWELDPDEGREALAHLHRFTTGALAEMRALLVELRPPALVEAPLHETLAVLAPMARARGVEDVEVRLAPAPLLPPVVHVALYRVAQEALNNVLKHARATHVAVTLAVTPDYVPGEPWEGTATLVVADDGRGFTPGSEAGEQFGLTTMRERAAEIGAALELDSALGNGTRVSVSWRGAARQPAEHDVLVF